jgi:hypothetical protein
MTWPPAWKELPDATCLRRLLTSMGSAAWSSDLARGGCRCALLTRLCAPVTPPRLQTVRYAGVLASASPPSGIATTHQAPSAHLARAASARDDRSRALTLYTRGGSWSPRATPWTGRQLAERHLLWARDPRWERGGPRGGSFGVTRTQPSAMGEGDGTARRRAAFCDVGAAYSACRHGRLLTAPAAASPPRAVARSLQ